MKKLLSILAIVLLVSCSKDEEPVDCNCNKVVDVLTMNIVGAGSTVSNTIYYRYTTINQCSGLQSSSGWSRNPVSKGECR